MLGLPAPVNPGMALPCIASVRPLCMLPRVAEPVRVGGVDLDAPGLLLLCRQQGRNLAMNVLEKGGCALGRLPSLPDEDYSSDDRMTLSSRDMSRTTGSSYEGSDDGSVGAPGSHQTSGQAVAGEEGGAGSAGPGQGGAHGQTQSTVVEIFNLALGACVCT